MSCAVPRATSPTTKVARQSRGYTKLYLSSSKEELSFRDPAKQPRLLLSVARGHGFDTEGEDIRTRLELADDGSMQSYNILFKQGSVDNTMGLKFLMWPSTGKLCTIRAGSCRAEFGLAKELITRTRTSSRKYLCFSSNRSRTTEEWVDVPLRPEHIPMVADLIRFSFGAPTAALAAAGGPSRRLMDNPARAVGDIGTSGDGAGVAGGGEGDGAVGVLRAMQVRQCSTALLEGLIGHPCSERRSIAAEGAHALALAGI